jgi:hypothetical protein
MSGPLLSRRFYEAGRQDWHVFTGSQCDAKSGEWEMSKLPVHHIID